MRDDISLDQATECAFQAELICRLMLNSDAEMTSGELATGRVLGRGVNSAGW